MPLVERVLDRIECPSLAAYRDRGGGRGLAVAQQFTPEEVIEEILASGLRGRGGAGFPTGIKWRTVADSAAIRGRSMVVNAAEGEPSTFKDRQLLRMNPYKVVEGALIAAYAVGAPRVTVATKSSFEREVAALHRAVAEMDDAGWTEGVDVRVLEGPSEYLFGEETGLLEVVAGRQPFPRVAPPYRRGTQSGGVTLVNNVETLANVTGILAHGATWFREVGTADSPGTIVCTMTGQCRQHAVGEVTMGTPLREAIELIGGGAAHVRVVGAMSGVANPIVPEELLDTELSYEAMAAIGSGLGAGGFYILDDQTDVVAVAAGAARFLAVESCGQCEPCKRDGLAIAQHLRELCESTGSAADLTAVAERLDTVTNGARCFLATQQQQVVASALRLFRGDFEQRATGEPASATPAPIVPVVDIVDGSAVLDTTHLTKQPDWSHDEPSSDAWPAAALAAVPVELDELTEAGVPEEDAPAGESIADYETPSTDPLQPLTSLHRRIGRALGRVVVAGGTGRALGDLRELLLLHDDVMQRVVHPWVARVAPGQGDDAVWQAELDELAAEHCLDAIGAHPDPDSGELRALIDQINQNIARNEQRTLTLLRAHMDDRQLEDLGDAVEEACASAVLTARH
jgi:NADH:ubiquinone oxidoreductase subunit F (NADH-binding)